ncbi:uncharacterized protein PRCAT00000855001 [Priceomyces carsonii]|uniref:uncharacterized protein n=1 Tax=Priceomyces carsonii TaxID=28549 RepID=UPI002EDB7093|nr:unnamed protein product [Priceomyces carsonii]
MTLLISTWSRGSFIYSEFIVPIPSTSQTTRNVQIDVHIGQVREIHPIDEFCTMWIDLLLLI